MNDSLDSGARGWLQVPARPASLDRIVQQVEAFCGSHSIDDVLRTALRLITDEIATNILKYAYPDDPGSLRFRVCQKESEVVLEFVDEGIPFDPRVPLAADKHEALGDRRIGGWGLHIVAEHASSIEYRRHCDRNWLRIRLNLG